MLRKPLCDLIGRRADPCHRIAPFSSRLSNERRYSVCLVRAWCFLDSLHDCAYFSYFSSLSFRDAVCSSSLRCGSFALCDQSLHVLYVRLSRVYSPLLQLCFHPHCFALSVRPFEDCSPAPMRSALVSLVPLSQLS